MQLRCASSDRWRHLPRPLHAPGLRRPSHGSPARALSRAAPWVGRASLSSALPSTRRTRWGWPEPHGSQEAMPLPPGPTAAQTRAVLVDEGRRGRQTRVKGLEEEKTHRLQMI